MDLKLLYAHLVPRWPLGVYGYEYFSNVIICAAKSVPVAGSKQLVNKSAPLATMF